MKVTHHCLLFRTAEIPPTFATVNEKDFRDCGFQRVWNPLAAD